MNGTDPRADSTARGYTAPARYLHWLIAGLIVLQYVLAELGESAGDAGEQLRQLAVLANHKSVGMTVLVLALLRLGWRVAHAPPPLPAVTPPWQRQAAAGAHWLLYGLIFALPVTGWLMSSASAYSVSWFNLFTFPDLLAPDPDLKDRLKTIHELLGEALFVLALVHVGAALWHHLKLQDNVLRGMAQTGAVALGVVSIAAGSIWLSASSGANTPAAAVDQIPAEVPAATASAETRETGIDAQALPPWEIDYAASHVRFTAEQAGAAFDGEFERWRADIRFAPERAAGIALVTIELASVDTADKERDGTLSDDAWFGGREAVFRAAAFTATVDGGFEAQDATLSFGADPHPVGFRFDVTHTASGYRLTGRARLDRLGLQVGTGEWSDTTWVGQFVDVDVVVAAKPNQFVAP